MKNYSLIKVLYRRETKAKERKANKSIEVTKGVIKGRTQGKYTDYWTEKKRFDFIDIEFKMSIVVEDIM